MKRIETLRSLWLSAAVALALAACATDRSVVEVAVPAAPPAAGAQLAAPAAPVGPAGSQQAGVGQEEGRPAVRIVAVRDLRRFEADSRDPTVPSLAAGDMADPAIRSRAVGRKRNGFGMALGDIMLPEGVTVENLVYSAAQRALVDKGYRVTSASGADRAQAMPLTIVIDRLWTSFTPGLLFVSLDFDARLLLHGDELLQRSPATVESHASRRGFGAFDSTWNEVVQDGLSELATQIQAELRSPDELLPEAPLTASSPTAELPRPNLPPPRPLPPSY